MYLCALVSPMHLENVNDPPLHCHVVSSCLSLRTGVGTGVEGKAAGESEYLEFCLQSRNFFNSPPLGRTEHREATEKSKAKERSCRERV